MSAPAADYFGMPGVNWSRLKHMRDSPMAYRWALETGMEDSDMLRSGRLLHTLVLEPSRFETDYALWTGKVRNGKVWDQFEIDHLSHCIVTPQQMRLAEAMAWAVLRSADAAPYLRHQSAKFEQTMQWIDPRTGLQCKARADILVRGLRAIADLKSAFSIDARIFGNQAARLGYHCQIAHYSNGCEATQGWKPEARKLIVVEKRPPHDVAVFDVGAEDFETGADEVAHLLGRARECADANNWPGRYTGEQALQLPAYITGGELEFENE